MNKIILVVMSLFMLLLVGVFAQSSGLNNEVKETVKKELREKEQVIKQELKEKKNELTNEAKEKIQEVKEKTKEELQEIREKTEEKIKELRGEKELVIAYIIPEKQAANIGEWAEYEIVVKDNHAVPECVGAEEKIVCSIAPLVYKLVFESETVKGEFKNPEINLGHGEKNIFKFSVSSEKQGFNSFVVNVVGEDAETKAKAILFVNEEGTYPEQIDASLFIGEGYAVSEDGSEGYLIDLKVLYEKNSDAIKGKISTGNAVFKISGTVEGNEIKFDFGKPESDSILGSFSGGYKKFPDFLLLEGNLVYDGKNYSLHAVSKNRLIIKEISVEDKEETKTKLKQVIALKKEEANEVIEKIVEGKEISKEEIEELKETYVRPLEIKKQKILGFIPNPWGDKILEIEVVKEGEIVKKIIKENKTEKIDGFDISVGSLEDKDNIELTVEQSPE